MAKSLKLASTSGRINLVLFSCFLRFMLHPLSSCVCIEMHCVSSSCYLSAGSSRVFTVPCTPVAGRLWLFFVCVCKICPVLCVCGPCHFVANLVALSSHVWPLIDFPRECPAVTHVRKRSEFSKSDELSFLTSFLFFFLVSMEGGYHGTHICHISWYSTCIVYILFIGALRAV